MEEQASRVYPPGSEPAIKDGCTCCDFQNACGLGYLAGVIDRTTRKWLYVVNEECPMHGRPGLTGDVIRVLD